ncbi:MAG TPA: MMPL family transporter [Thermoleophilaceae bacterium]|nr:MMPL family transporter [Thermoleophilaceae bacterium]
MRGDEGGRSGRAAGRGARVPVAHGRQAGARRRGRRRVHRRGEGVRAQPGPERAEPRPAGQPDLDDPGPSGTGKSVCIKHMVGLLYPDEGDVLVHGESVPNMADDELFEMRKKFGVLFQDGALFGSMNVFDNTALVFRSRPRLLPLVLALAAAAMTFGALSLAGGSLTMASVAVLPVLIGLAVDYAIQFQARFDEERARRPGRPPDESAVAAAAAGGPTIVTAGIATAVGFLVLLLSPVPMVRGFGALLVLGVGLALTCAICAGFAALVRAAAAAGRRRLPRRFRACAPGWPPAPVTRACTPYANGSPIAPGAPSGRPSGGPARCS